MDSKTIEQIILEKFQIKMQQTQPDLARLSGQMKIKQWYDMATELMVTNLCMTLLGRRSVVRETTIKESNTTEKVPINRWEHLKEAIFHGIFQDKNFPIKYREIKTYHRQETNIVMENYHYCPHLQYDYDNQHHIAWMMRGQK